MQIQNISLKKIIASNKIETVEATVSTENKTATASCPVGLSTGRHEAVHAPKPVDDLIKKFPANSFVGISTQEELDQKLKQIDGTNNFSKLGSCISTSISFAFSKILDNLLPSSKNIIPKLLSVQINGGKHNKNGPEIQEFLTISANESTAISKQIHETLAKKYGKTEGVEGGFDLKVENEKALEILSSVIEEISADAKIGIDVAASSFCKDNQYVYKTKKRDAEEQFEYLKELAEKYKLYYIEDPFNEDDFDMHALLTKKTKSIVCGDDLFTTNIKRLKEGITKKACNAIIIKANQIGTLTDTLDTIKEAQSNRYKTVVSHRSGETNDTWMIDLAFSTNADIIKLGITDKISEYKTKIQRYNFLNNLIKNNSK